MTDKERLYHQLKGIVYAYDNKDKNHPNHPTKLGKVFLDHKIEQARKLLNEFDYE